MIIHFCSDTVRWYIASRRSIQSCQFYHSEQSATQAGSALPNDERWIYLLWLVWYSQTDIMLVARGMTCCGSSLISEHEDLTYVAHSLYIILQPWRSSGAGKLKGSIESVSQVLRTTSNSKRYFSEVGRKVLQVYFTMAFILCFKTITCTE